MAGVVVLQMPEPARAVDLAVEAERQGMASVWMTCGGLLAYPLFAGSDPRASLMRTSAAVSARQSQRHRITQGRPAGGSAGWRRCVIPVSNPEDSSS